MKKSIALGLNALLISGCIVTKNPPINYLVPILNPKLKSLETKVNYDNSNTLVLESEIEMALRFTYQIRKTRDIKITIDEKVINYKEESVGTATPVFEKDNYVYFLTVKHVIYKEKFLISQENWDLITEDGQNLDVEPVTEVSNSKFYLYNPYLDKSFEASDAFYESFSNLGLVRVPSNEYIKPIPFKIEKNNCLHIGDYVYNIGYPGCLSGIITPAMNSGHIIAIIPAKQEGCYPNYASDNHMTQGDSGGPVYALREGHMVLIGAMDQIIGTDLNAHSIFNSLTLLDDFLEGSK